MLNSVDTKIRRSISSMKTHFRNFLYFPHNIVALNFILSTTSIFGILKTAGGVIFCTCSTIRESKNANLVYF